MRQKRCSSPPRFCKLLVLLELTLAQICHKVLLPQAARPLLLLLAALPALAAIQGYVENGTTGRKQGGVAVSLVKLDAGMQPIGSASSDDAGKFRFDSDVSGVPMLLRAEFQGVTYSEMLQPGARAGDVKVTVYAASTAPAPPEQHVMLLEPSGRELIVNESFLFNNAAQPPVTYVDPKQGTLRFYLPAGANGVVQVNTQGPAGMPIRASADKTGEPDIYKISFPIKPGENRVDLTYKVPYSAGMEFSGRTLYQNVATRIAAPAGVEIAGEGLRSMGEEPQSKAAIFSLGVNPFRVTISGQGKLSRSGDSGGGGGGDSISIIPAAVYGQFWVILGFAAAILGLGFYGFYTASGNPASTPIKKRKS